MLYILYPFISIAQKILSYILYPIMFIHRDWARERAYAINNDYIIKTVHGGEGSNSVKWELVDKKPINNIKDIIAWIVWWFLDDTPEYLDAGGNWFHRNMCDNDSGCEKTLFGMMPEITNMKRYFCCSYRWSALRNSMVNFNREVLTVHKAIHSYKIIYDTTDQIKVVDGYTITKPNGAKYKMENKIFLPDRSILGTQIYESVTNDKKSYYCIESAKVYNLFGFKFYIIFWYGYLKGTLRFEGNIDFGKHRI